MSSKVVTTKAKLLGTSTANWKIVGWAGPLGDLVRSRAECLVNIPINTSTDEIQLRFYLKPYHDHSEWTQIFCEKVNNYKHIDTPCDCNSCKEYTLKDTYKIPIEFLPKCATRSSGYELLVDVLKGPINFALAITMTLDGGNWYGPRDKWVFVDEATIGLSVDQTFWRVIKWTEGKDGKMENCVNCLQAWGSGNDAAFLISVSAYEVISTVTDQAALQKSDYSVEHTGQEVKQDTNSNSESESGSDAEFQVIDEPIDTSHDGGSSIDSGYEIVETRNIELSNGEEFKNIQAEFAKLLKQFQQLTQSKENSN